MAEIDYSTALQTVMAAADLLKERAPEPERAFEILKPLETCDGFPSVSPEHSTAMMSAIWALLGDCHRLMHRPREAADCYRRALTYSPRTGFAPFYAEVVLTNQFENHYASALEALNAAQASWARNSMWVRLKYNLISMWKDLGAWKQSRKARGLAERLRELVSAKVRNSRPTAEDAARRLVILKHVVASALGAPPREMLQKLSSKWDTDERDKFQRQAESQREQFWRGLRDAGLWQHLSPREQAHAQSTMATMTERQQVDASWRMEAAQALMWALAMLPELPPYDTVASHDLLKQIPSRDVTTFIKSARLREQAELDRARDTAEFWHWRSRTRQLIERGDAFPDDEKMKAAGFRSHDDIVRFSARNGAQEGTIPPCIGDDFPAKGKAYRDLTEEEWSEIRSITAERHFALNWLCGYAPDNRWDETPTDT